MSLNICFYTIFFLVLLCHEIWRNRKEKKVVLKFISNIFITIIIIKLIIKSSCKYNCESEYEWKKK